MKSPFYFFFRDAFFFFPFATGAIVSRTFSIEACVSSIRFRNSTNFRLICSVSAK